MIFPLVSILVPCYNEESHIKDLVKDILAQTYPVEKLEVFFIDGDSADSTRETLLGLIPGNSNFYYLHNERRYVPYALNLGISASRGEIIMRMDAHSRYPASYVETLVANLRELGADNVGGAWNTVPSGDGIISLAIAESMSSVFGVGNALYRLGSQKIRQVDTVPFGCYPREVFNRYGLFDEEMTRNQDDEFNARLIRGGGRIFLIPSVVITYYARENLTKVMKMFYQYGFFKPLVNIKVGKPATVRQFIPPIFVVVLFLLFVGSFWIPALIRIGCMIMGMHILLGVIFSIPPIRKTKRIALMAILPIVFLCNHLSYGIGYVAGTWRFRFSREKNTDVVSSR
jgi:glycosyltransferase involved in cell wall biosynthesis